MANPNRPAGKAANTPLELSEEQLAEAAGGFNPQPDPPKVARPDQVVNIALPPSLVGVGKIAIKP